jgi:uridine kinase
MARWAPAKNDTLDALANEIRHNYSEGRAIVAVDATSAAGGAAFADALADALRTAGSKVFRASLDDFHTAKASREGTDAQAYFDHAFDYSVLQRVLISPFRASGSTGFVLAAYDAKRGAQIQPKWVTAGPDAILVLDGPFLNRPELAGLWSYSVFVEVPLDQPEQSTVESEADILYVVRSNPRAIATAIIDNRIEETPRRVFADDC